MPAIQPLAPPYAPDLQATFDHLMPEGHEPLSLFRTLARSRRVFDRFLAGSLLDDGPLTLRQREVVILRTCALSGCEYEWGVHVAIFSGRAAFGPIHIAATLSADLGVWADDERALVEACDDLHRTTRIANDTAARLRAHFDEAQLLEVIALCGFYRTVSLFANATELAPEPFAPRFPAGASLTAPQTAASR